jgi:hypothetical protein
VERDTKIRYRELLVRLSGGDLEIDFGALRRAYSESEDFQSGGEAAQQSAMFVALGERDFARAITSARQALDIKYVGIDAHFTLYIAYQKTGETEKSKFHYAIWKGLIDSIFASGDGMSTETALEVIGIDEEYAIIRVLGAELKKQALHFEGDHKYDILTITRLDTQEEA